MMLKNVLTHGNSFNFPQADVKQKFVTQSVQKYNSTSGWM